MTLTFSPQMRIVAALGGLAALGLAAFMLTIGRSSPAATQSGLTPAEQSALNGKPKAKTHAKPKAAPVVPAAPKRAVTPAPKPKPAPAITLVPGLPPDLAHALRAHKVVVVSVYDPQARVDKTARAEASAAAALTHTGFVPLSVLDQRQAGPLMRQLGVLPDPAVLVYQRPGKLVARFDGFADRDTVAQAVTNALPSVLSQGTAVHATATPVVTLASWASGANQACVLSFAGVQRIKRDAPRAQFLSWAPSVLAAEQQLVVKLTALPLPTGSSDRPLAQGLIDGAARYGVAEKRLYEAAKRNDKPEIRQLVVAENRVIADANGAATAAGAPACAKFGR